MFSVDPGQVAGITEMVKLGNFCNRQVGGAEHLTYTADLSLGDIIMDRFPHISAKKGV